MGCAGLRVVVLGCLLSAVSVPGSEPAVPRCPLLRKGFGEGFLLWANFRQLWKRWWLKTYEISPEAKPTNHQPWFCWALQTTDSVEMLVFMTRCCFSLILVLAVSELRALAHPAAQQGLVVLPAPPCQHSSSPLQPPHLQAHELPRELLKLPLSIAPDLGIPSALHRHPKSYNFLEPSEQMNPTLQQVSSTRPECSIILEIEEERSQCLAEIAMDNQTSGKGPPSSLRGLQADIPGLTSTLSLPFLNPSSAGAGQ
ncbi:hypothetical protein Anapl_11851 [Anas platyrhynchos]|uniref:Uncharacterized protein n=1 Tax=Anas platyrhynchos TaxID=8839 RepID=R0JMM3_ANAPL|nr:hypothetical protein Anapl_11851 [Anas platyrhynchos]